MVIVLLICFFVRREGINIYLSAKNDITLSWNTILMRLPREKFDEKLGKNIKFTEFYVDNGYKYCE